ncbi:hypothetical protein ACJX0J_040284, partial [Zea mays]
SIGRATAYLLIILDHACIHMFQCIKLVSNLRKFLITLLHYIPSTSNIYTRNFGTKRSFFFRLFTEKSKATCIKTCSYILKVHVYDSNRSKQHAVTEVCTTEVEVIAGASLIENSSKIIFIT